MPGPPPKHATTRARRNKVAGAKTLQAVPDLEVPELPDPELMVVADGETPHQWHPLTAKWWSDIWSSPMAPEFDTSDIHGLYLLAMLVNAFWYEPSQALAAEIRLQRQCFGLSPIDRRRLQWEIARGEEAEKATAQTRAAKKPTAAKAPAGLARGPKKAADPRQMLAN